MRDLRILGALVLAVSVFSGSINAAEKAKGATAAPQITSAQKMCPVMGSPIDTSIFVDYQGKRVYFCCKGCPAEFGKDPKKYLKILADKGESVRIVDSVKAGLKPAKGDESAVSGATKKLVAQKTCPIMGGEIDKKLFVDYQGKRIYVCCGGCIDAVKKDPEAALKKLADLGQYAVDVPAK